MNNKDLFYCIGDIDEDLIVRAEKKYEANTILNSVNNKKNVWTKFVAVAVCIILLVGTVTAFATTEFGTKLIESFKARQEGLDYTESGFDLSVAIKRISVNDLSKEIQDVKGVIKKQFKDHKLYDNSFPGVCEYNFESRKDACEYIGLKQIKLFDCDWVEQSNSLNVYGNEDGNILNIDVETCYSIDDVRIQLFTKIYTKNYNEEIVVGARTTEDIDFKESFFSTKNNIQCHVLESSALDCGYLCMDGYIIDNGVLYNLHIAYSESDSNKAINILHQWADLF